MDIITTSNHFIEPSVGVVFKECCTITAVDALAIQAIEQVHISGCIPEGERTRRTSDITHAHNISCLCDVACDSISICGCIYTALVDAVLDGCLHIEDSLCVNTEESTAHALI